MPYAALVTVTVAVVVWVLGRLAARAVRRGRRPRLPPRAPAPKRLPAGTGTVEIGDGLFSRARLDDVPHPTAGITASPPRGFSRVPAGPHVIRLVSEEKSNKFQEIHVIVAAEERVVIGLDHAGAPAVVARGPEPSAFDASYIHYPPWPRGVRLTILARAVRARDPQGA